MVPDESSGTIDVGHCHECKKEIEMSKAVADPNGKPLCKDCFNTLVRRGKDASDLDELI